MKARTIKMLSMLLVSILVCGYVSAGEKGKKSVKRYYLSRIGNINTPYALLKSAIIGSIDNSHVGFIGKILRPRFFRRYRRYPRRSMKRYFRGRRRPNGKIKKALTAAKEYLKEIVNPDSYRLRKWYVRRGNLYATFSLPERKSMRIRIIVNLRSLEPVMAASIKESIIETRQNISARMRVNMEEVHINGITSVPVFRTYGQPSMAFHLTARVRQYRLKLEYKKDVRNKRHMTIRLVSFKDKNRDYVKDAKNKIIDIFNPESHDITVGRWAIDIDGSLLLDMLMYHEEEPYPHPVYESILVTVDLNTGDISIKESIIDAVTKARQMTSFGLRTDYADAHVNALSYLLSRFIKDGLAPKGYVLYVMTPGFALTYKYDIESGKLELRSLVSTELGKDLLEAAADHLVGIVNPDEFTLYKWGLFTDKVAFGFMLEGLSMITVSVDLNTGIPSIAEYLTNMILATRNYAAGHVGVGIEDVHINAVEPGIIYMGDRPYYSLKARVGCLIIETRYYTDDGSIELISVKNKDTNENLLKNAEDHLKNNFSPEEYELIEWQVKDDNVIFNFDIGDNSTVEVEVDISDGGVRRTVRHTYIYDGERLTRHLIYGKSYDQNGTLTCIDWKYTFYYVGSTKIEEGKNTYKENGRTLKETMKNTKRFNAAGNLQSIIEERTIYGDTSSDYDYYRMNVVYDSQGNVILKNSTIFVSHDGIKKGYTSVYDVDNDYTHVYDEDGNEVSDLGGEGDIHPRDIIKTINGGMGKASIIEEPKSDIEEKQANEDKQPVVNNEFLAKMRVEYSKETRFKNRIGDYQFTGKIQGIANKTLLYSKR